jgi:hypothetical protein
LSKGRFSSSPTLEKEEHGFDKLSPNGYWFALDRRAVGGFSQ